MDIIKKKSSKSRTKLYISATIAITALVSAMVLNNNNVSLAKNTLLIAKVKQGDLAISVEGYGKLVSEKLKLITAATQATVSEVLLKPGAQVSEKSIIAVLENPYLTQQLTNEQQELAQLQANFRQLKVNQQREKLTEQAMLTEVKSAYQSARLKRQAQQQLVDQGIISQITFQQSQLDENQLDARVKILANRLQKLSLVHLEALNIQQQRIEQQLGKLTSIEQQIEQLTVKANFEGVIQHMAIKLGQSLQAGQEIAVIGSTKRLIAEIVIPQNQASLVQLTQQVTIDTRQTTITGEVSRIDPIVENNMVKVDIKLNEQLPSNARPEQSVDANIITKVLKNVSYIEKPINVMTNSQHTLYRLNSTQAMAKRTKISFGETAGRYIQINSAIKPGEHFILSDLSNYQSETIHLH
ncbi:hypothetical protein tinsulaeT_18920 [Thalassotalea insulae]|uniref:RND transporter n=1 Tax=Thalassotalea insulae TaxID=2056778 RepID=A0ABQ6GRJ8_9GAMM|nr:HlyD family efflux transporter periplasmic adaptor subunit [Thalassotalea insulae]GLX78552.1 hypothetical protein tinsulaeT_18920 [Thalassotalea insulae]